MGICFGNGFLNTRRRPVNTDLDFGGLPFTFRSPFLRVSLVMGTGLAPSLLASSPLGLRLLVRLSTSFYLTRGHLQLGHPLVFL